MSSRTHEVHVERLVGRIVRDVDGAIIGRLEELRSEVVDGEHVVIEVHVGPAAMVERIARFIRQIPLLSVLPYEPWEYRISWRLVDLGDPTHPRVSCKRASLRREPPDR